MCKKYFLLSAIVVLSFNANAGLFDSNDFKCGREDAVKALSDFIRNDASGLLQSNFITKGKMSFSRSLDVYQSKLDSLGLTIENVSTLDSGAGEKKLSCSATISIKLPQETLDVINDDPSELSLIKGYYGKIVNGSVTWGDIGYSVKLADNKKDILVSELSKNDASSAMYSAVAMAVDKDKIINNNSKSKLNTVRYDYEEADGELNSIWKDLPDSARSTLKNGQLAWVNDKAIKCGKLSDAKSDVISIQQRISIYQCQKKMTNERISYLSGNSN